MPGDHDPYWMMRQRVLEGIDLFLAQEIDRIKAIRQYLADNRTRMAQFMNQHAMFAPASEQNRAAGNGCQHQQQQQPQENSGQPNANAGNQNFGGFVNFILTTRRVDQPVNQFAQLVFLPTNAAQNNQQNATGHDANVNFDASNAVPADAANQMMARECNDNAGTAVSSSMAAQKRTRKQAGRVKREKSQAQHAREMELLEAFIHHEPMGPGPF